MEITKEDFEAYVRVQKSGVTNMWAVKLVSELSGLTKEQCLDIMKNYLYFIQRSKSQLFLEQLRLNKVLFSSLGRRLHQQRQNKGGSVSRFFCCPAFG